MKPDPLYPRDRMVADSLSRAFGAEQSLPQAMARKIRRRRIRNKLAGVGMAAVVLALIFSFSGVRRAGDMAPEIGREKAPDVSRQIVASPNLGYEIATDEDVHHFLRGYSIFIVPQSGNAGAKRVVWLEARKTNIQE